MSYYQLTLVVKISMGIKEMGHCKKKSKYYFVTREKQIKILYKCITAK